MTEGNSNIADVREEIAKAAGLPEGWGQRLVGDSEAELKADAEALAPTVQAPKEEPEHVALARRAIEAAQNNPNRGGLIDALNADKNAQNRQLVDALHRPTPEPEAEGEGGPTSAPADPEQDHNKLVAELLRRERA